MSDPRAIAPAIEFIPKTPQEAVKAILVIVVTLFAALRASLSGDGEVTPIEGIQLLIQALTLIPVFILSGVWPKTISAFLLAGLQALIPPISALAGWTAWSSLTFDDYAGAILAAMLAVGIAVIPNAPAPAPKEVVVVNESPETKPATVDEQRAAYVSRSELARSLTPRDTSEPLPDVGPSAG